MGDANTHFLNIATAFDAIHDFGKGFPHEFLIDHSLYKTPGYSNAKQYINENFMEIVAGRNEIKKPEDTLLEYFINYRDIEELRNAIRTNNYNIDVDTFNGNKFRVKMLNKNKRSKLKGLGKLNKSDLLTFFNRDDINLLVDTSFISIMYKICEADNVEDLDIHALTNRERLNDSGKKSNDVLKGLKPNLFDATQDDIVYDRDTQFNTNYNLRLGTINKNNKLVKFQILNGDQVLHKSNSGASNSVPKCKAALNKKGLDNDTKKAILELKRSGDWLQALSCLDTDRVYEDVSGNIIDIDNIILVTGDRVLLIYSLFIGINVLFTAKVGTNGDGELLYFKNLNTGNKPKPAAKHKRIISNVERVNNSNVMVVNNSNNNSNVIVLNNSNNSPKAKRYKKAENSMDGGQDPLHMRLQAYYKELAETIEGFDNDEDLDYDFYENVACTVLACAKVFLPDELESIFFKTLPSVEGYIRTDNENLVGFFKGDKYSADCISFAARQVALGSLGLRTGTLTSLSEKHIDINPMASGAYDAVYSALPKDFGQRQMHIIKMIGELQHVVERPVHNVQQPLHNTHHKTIRRNNRRHVIRHTTRKSRSG
jgi:hypothetical protein